VAVAVGGFWYLRNIAQHGSPLWPFVDMPWGDPSPRFLGAVDQTLLARPGDTLDGRLGQYEDLLGGAALLLLGGLLVLLAGLLVPLRRPGLRRALILSGLLSAASLLIWSASWGTGMQTSPELATPAGWPISTVRYLLPGIAVAILAVALATRAPGPIGVVARLVLGAALVWSVLADARFGSPWTPSLPLLLAGAAAGTLVAGAAALLARRAAGERGPASQRWAPALGLGLAVAIGALAAPVATGYVERSTRVIGSTQPAPELITWFSEQPGFEDENYPVSMASRAVLSSLAGDRFQHPLELVPARAGCDQLRRVARREPLVVTTAEWFEGIIGVNPYSAPGCLSGSEPAFHQGVYTVLLPPRPALAAARDAGGGP
jgi:hypothetical protein